VAISKEVGPNGTEGWDCWRLAGADRPASGPAARVTDPQLVRALGRHCSLWEVVVAAMVEVVHPEEDPGKHGVTILASTRITAPIILPWSELGSKFLQGAMWQGRTRLQRCSCEVWIATVQK